MNAKVDPALLKGLNYRFAEHREEERDGKKVRVPVPKVRPATPEDVIGFRDAGDRAFIVLSDGSRHEVPKASGKGKGA